MESSSPPLAGKAALITGGSRGIGAAIARRLAHDGADVAITFASAPAKADDVVRAIEATGRRALAVRAEATDAGAVRDAVAKTVAAFGRLDVLVNNAGIALMAPLEQFTLEDFDRMFAVNVRAAFVATQAAAPHMGAGGRVIMIGSVNADRMPFAGGAVYAMTKAGIAGLTRGLARDLGPREITVNAVQPGPVDTDMNPASGPFAENLRALMALKRYGTADEVAGMVAYLASPIAGYVTGACLTIDGGFDA